MPQIVTKMTRRAWARVRRWLFRGRRAALASAASAPTPDDIRRVLSRSPRRAYGLYVSYRRSGGVPHRFRPHELSQLIAAGGE
jgi:hypothetical protein